MVKGHHQGTRAFGRGASSGNRGIWLRGVVREHGAFGRGASSENRGFRETGLGCARGQGHFQILCALGRTLRTGLA